MAYFPDSMPGVEPNMDDRDFWRSCDEKRLAFQTCASCDAARHPPTPICAACSSTQVKWTTAPSRATVYTYTVIHHASHPAVDPMLPYVVAVLTFEGVPGVRLVSNITDVSPAAVFIGMSVDLWWDVLADGSCIPRFKPIQENDS